MVWVETVVGALLSGFLQVLFDRMATRQFVDFFRKRFDGTDLLLLLERLKMILLTVNVVLSDAEEKQITNPFVKGWVDELKNVVYQAEDFLDEIATLALTECQASNNPVQNSNICETLQSRLHEIIKKLENIAQHKDVLGLKESFGGKLYPRLPTTSLVDECKVYGRNKNKNKIMDFLFSVRENGTEIPIIAIAGMAGVGKTTLAQLLYNDSRVKKHFRTRAWAYVSEEFDVFKVTKTIYESVTSRDCNITDLNLIQIRLKEELVGKKFLLVLDDVWNENFISWDFLQNSFKDGAKGSRIIVTTRSHSVASAMGASLTHSLQQLSYEDCWSVFETHAFRSINSQTHPKLKPIGEKIVKKCQGLPLAAKIIGSLLHSKVEAHEWDNILNSKIWDLRSDKSNILPSLSLSYYYLPSHLKQCFAYCSILPKGYVFERETLVMLWMAEGFLQQPRDKKCMEEVGNCYFDELISMSLFQKSGVKPGFVMHDLVNELAQFVSGEFCFHSESGELHGISEKTRHFSYARDKFDGFEALNEAKFLRTFLPLSLSSNPSGSNHICQFMVHTLLPSLSSLRALSLSGYKIITTCPDINKLKHLRFLDFSGTAITELPESTCSLYNLQTLKLLDCFQLVKLPAKMRNLIQLGYLHLNGTRSLKELPPEFGRLKNLQILTTFVVSNNTGASCISELGGLLRLRGKLSILELQNVQDIADAENAKLKDKQCIKELAFHWNNNGHDQETETVVLEKLHPHKNIENISIEGYNGTKLPDWLGNSLFDNMVILRISDCKNCSSFPPLGQLSSLQKLFILKCPELIGKLPDHFPSLELLYIDQCCKLDFPSDDIKDYRNLQVLQIKSSCDPLTKITLSFFNKLKHFKIQDCRNLNCIEIFNDHHQELKLLQHFEISNCDDLKAFSGGRMHSPNLTSFSFSNCNSLQSISMPEHMNTPKLTSFSVSNCNSLESFPKYEHTPKLKSFLVSNCKSLQSMPRNI
ncbi:hypothetical protein Ddye_031706 [Dipteronia dyeriana]|uniref:Disease resistance RPP13-like protein 1 n=1 Tax=Dipteronia dyeriana TaxID=168575 RepID=A0AAD9WMJ4_9ROSI|nr:hypothetical protein Ddye_031706 [Dipteronia dyeriana]